MSFESFVAVHLDIGLNPEMTKYFTHPIIIEILSLKQIPEISLI